MTANQLLIAIIGLFIVTTGFMYLFHIREKGEGSMREKLVSYTLVVVGLLVLLVPAIFAMLDNGEVSTRGKSKLLGKDAFGPPPPAIKGSYEEAGSYYAKGIALWNPSINGFDSTDQVMNYLSKSIELYETAEARSALGQLKFQLGKMREAIEDYRRAIELKPTYSNPYFLRAAVYFVMNDLNRACEDWRKAAELGMSAAADLVTTKCG